MTEDRDRAYMARAIQLAAKGLYTTDPNPRVGCVIVKGDEVVGMGWHQRAGAPHAERLALADAGSRARGATAYVSLEPCCHQGRTPPCTQALREAGIARVVAGMVDPNPRVAGEGLAQLRAWGIQVVSGVLEEEARALNPGFIKRMTQGLPFVRLKLAASLDGRTALANGESRWITSPEARRDVHRFRARSSAILTGIGTVLADDPSLTVRLDPEALDLPEETPIRQPLRVLVDSRLRTPPRARMLSLPGMTLIACIRRDADRAPPLERAGARIQVCPEADGRVQLASLLRILAADREVNEVLIESGPTLAGAVLDAGLVDELLLYLAPHLLGDRARGLVHLPVLERMRDRRALVFQDVRRVGPDLRIQARPVSSRVDSEDDNI